MRGKFRDYYRVLRISPTAGVADIKAAFRRLARRHHPDAGTGTPSARRFRGIREAYEVLSDPEKRGRYDRLYQERPSPRRRTFGLGIDVLGLRIGVQVETVELSRKGYRRASIRRDDRPDGSVR